MMKIEKKVGKRILINGKELRLDTYCDNDNMWFWYIYTKEEVDLLVASIKRVIKMF